MKTIEITKHEALALAIIAASVGEKSGQLSQKVIDFVEMEVEGIENTLNTYGNMSIEDTNALILNLLKKGLAND